MTLDEAQELFPVVAYDSPQDSFGYIYVTFEPISGKFYIGKKSRHNWQPAYYGGGHYLTKWKNENLELKHWPIQWCYSNAELSQAEHNWVDKFKDNIDNVNLVEGGGGPTGRGGAKIISEETLQRLRNANSGENNYFYGKSHTEEMKKLFSDKRKEYFLTHDNYWKGKHLPEELKEKIRQKALERNLDPEYRKANSERLKKYYETHEPAFLGCQHTEETKKQMSNRKAELYNKERVEYTPNTSKLVGCAKDRRKVICLDTGEIFNSIVDASNAYGSKGSHIGDVCRGLRRTAFGKHWAFYEENSEPSSLPDYSYSNELGFLERKTCLA